jgi:hypothetical protein
LGAAFTACSLFFVLRNFNEYIGLPTTILSYLSLVGLVYCAYSVLCYLLLKNNWTVWLRIIGMANLLYCALTIAFLFLYFNNLTQLGLIYFLGEILIILSLVYLEFRVATLLRTNKTTA